jgi:ElaB/YqjD/DUF883 family membrane-anchored ribosome-binding protein
MFSNQNTPPVNGSKGLAQVGQAAAAVIQSTQQRASEAVSSLAVGVQDLRDQAAPLLSRAADQTSAMAKRAVHAVQDGAESIRDRAHDVSHTTKQYIRVEPVKSVLIAAAAGAALMALLSLLSRRRD